MSNTQTIYFDESGFTGNNLLSRDQPVFVYAGVAIDPPHASLLRNEMISRFGIKSSELKGKNLVRSEKGRQAISWLLSQCKDVVCVSIADKNYALAGKFFEYIFEPVLKPQNSLFYAVGFHRYIANLLYVMVQARRRRAEDVLNNFEMLMRTRTSGFLEPLFAPQGLGVEFREPLDLILTFGLCHREIIQQELRGLSEIEGISRWVLELTTTCLFWILSYWSERFDSMEVYCDKSKPLDADRSVFDVMVGREDKIYMKLGSQPEHALTYNLAKPIELIDSRHSPGIQIADVITTSVAFALKNPEAIVSKEWLELTEGMTSTSCILPDPNEIDLQKRKPFVNSMILYELVDRSIKGTSLFTDMDKFIAGSARAFLELQRSHTA
jgi:hypothetical protein